MLPTMWTRKSPPSSVGVFSVLLFSFWNTYTLCMVFHHIPSSSVCRGVLVVLKCLTERMSFWWAGINMECVSRAQSLCLASLGSCVLSTSGSSVSCFPTVPEFASAPIWWQHCSESHTEAMFDLWPSSAPLGRNLISSEVQIIQSSLPTLDLNSF